MSFGNLLSMHAYVCTFLSMDLLNLYVLAHWCHTVLSLIVTVMVDCLYAQIFDMPLHAQRVIVYARTSTNTYPFQYKSTWLEHRRMNEKKNGTQLFIRILLIFPVISWHFSKLIHVTAKFFTVHNLSAIGFQKWNFFQFDFIAATATIIDFALVFWTCVCVCVCVCTRMQCDISSSVDGCRQIY